MKARRKTQETERASSIPIILSPSSVQSAVGGVHQESDSTATNEHARTDFPQIPVFEDSAIIVEERRGTYKANVEATMEAMTSFLKLRNIPFIVIDSEQLHRHSHRRRCC